jgi:glutaredoxin-like protein NrdH
MSTELQPTITEAVTAAAAALSVTVYSTPNCQQCRMTYRALDKAEISYVVVDLAANDNARTWVSEDLGYSQAPVVVVDQDPEHHWSGFRPDQITALRGVGTAARNQSRP